jgi:putative hydrolase of the HAD superfamily
MSKKKIKLIIFDLSNVCFSMEEPPFIHAFCLKHNIPEKEFDGEYQALLERAEVDEISGQEIWRKMLAKYNLSGDPKKIIKEMMSQKYEHEDVLRLVRRLRESGLPVVYLTNYNRDYWEVIAARWDMKKYFSSGLVSYEIKARKPALSGFHKLMENYKVKPEETLFIDDSAGNLHKAKGYGILGHLFKSALELAKFLEKEKLL